MTVGYHQVKQGQRLYPNTAVKRVCRARRGQVLQRLHGAGLDVAIAELLLAQMTPSPSTTDRSTKTAGSSARAARLRAQQWNVPVRCELAQRRFLRVDPETVCC